MVPLRQVALHKVPTTASRKSVMPFRHGHYLTTLHSFAHVRQTQKFILKHGIVTYGAPWQVALHKLPMAASTNPPHHSTMATI